MSFFCSCYQIPFLRHYFLFNSCSFSVHPLINSFKICLLNSCYMLCIWLDDVERKWGKERVNKNSFVPVVSILWNVTFLFLMFSMAITCRFYHFHFTDKGLGSERLRICIENTVDKRQNYDLTPGISWFYPLFPSYMGDR